MFSRRQLGTLALAATLLGVVGCGDNDTTVYVVRHAEKADGGKMGDPAAAKDPDLSAAGFARANALPKALSGAKLSAIFSSPYKRTRQTAAPAARAQGLSVEELPADDVAGLVTKLKALKKGSAALIAGHSNTVPAIIKALGVSTVPEIGHDDYGDLYVVTLSDPPRLEKRRFEP